MSVDRKIKKFFQSKDLADVKLKICNGNDFVMEKYHKLILSMNSIFLKNLFSTNLKKDVYVDEDGLEVFQIETPCIQSTLDIISLMYGIDVQFENFQHIFNILQIKDMLCIKLDKNFTEKILFSKSLEIEYIPDMINILNTHNKKNDIIVDNIMSFLTGNSDITKEDKNRILIENFHFFEKFDEIIIILYNKNIDNNCYIISILTQNVLCVFPVDNKDYIRKIFFNEKDSENMEIIFVSEKNIYCCIINPKSNQISRKSFNIYNDEVRILYSCISFKYRFVIVQDNKNNAKKIDLDTGHVILENVIPHKIEYLSSDDKFLYCIEELEYSKNLYLYETKNLNLHSNDYYDIKINNSFYKFKNGDKLKNIFNGDEIIDFHFKIKNGDSIVTNNNNFMFLKHKTYDEVVIFGKISKNKKFIKTRNGNYCHRYNILYNKIFFIEDLSFRFILYNDELYNIIFPILINIHCFCIAKRPNSLKLR